MKKKIIVNRDDDSPTGYFVRYGEEGVPATPYIIRLWHMYVEALDLAQRLRDEIEELTVLQINHAAEEEGNIK